jgi:hypothetical protein
MFTDMVGSTELSTALDPEAAEKLRQAHFGLLRSALTATGGNEVKNLGDGLMVAFSSLSRALACAVAMQQAADRHSRRAEHLIAIRVGLSTGEATEEDGDFFGEPVIEASRLCAHAEGGQILTTAMARALAGRHATQEFVVLGDVNLKGLPEPVEVVEVRWAPAEEDVQEGIQLPLPGRLVAISAGNLFAFFGRDQELETLDEVAKRSTTEYRLGVVLISGEPGVGKTSLVAQAARATHDSRGNVLYGGCDEDLAVPYKPWVESITPLVRSCSDDALRRFTEANGLALARLVPDLARRLGSEPPPPSAETDAERFMIMEAVVRFLGAASEESPLLLILDDLHWADAASLQLLGQLARTSDPMAVTVVGTFRDSDLSRSHALTRLLARLHREPGVRRMSLVGFEDFEVIGLMEAAAGHRLPNDGVALAHALRRETGGNPFFVVEMIRHLAQEGAFVQGEDGIWRLTVDLDTLGLPTSVREVVAQRIASLGVETEQALSMASVIGRDFDLSVLAALLDADELALMDRMEQAIAVGILAETDERAGRYRFVHALMQHSLYQDLSASRRQRAHHRVAEILEASNVDDPRQLAALARHWLAATRQADASKAAHYARRAGQAALGAYAPADAVMWYSQALEIIDRLNSPNEYERGWLLCELGTAQFRAGMPEYRQNLLDAAEIAQRTDNADLLVAAALGSRRGDVRSIEADPEQQAVVEAALAALGERNPGTRALLLATLAEATDARDWPRRLELANEAVSVADRLPNDVSKLDILTSCYLSRCQPERLAERLAETARAFELAELLGDPIVHFAACFDRVHAAMEAGDVAEADRCIAEMSALVERTGLPFCRWQLLLTQSWRATLNGELDEAERLIDEGFAVATDIGMGEAQGAYGGVLFEIRMEQGRIDELIEPFAQAAAENPALGVLRSAVAFAYCSLGRVNEALPLFSLDASTKFVENSRDVSWTSRVALEQGCAVALKDRDAAATLYDLILPFADIVVFNTGTCQGALARSLGRLAHLLGRVGEAEEHFNNALAINGRLKAKYYLALTQLDFADFLRDAERPSEAAEMVGCALETSRQCGFAGLEERATAFSA